MEAFGCSFKEKKQNERQLNSIFNRFRKNFPAQLHPPYTWRGKLSAAKVQIIFKTRLKMSFHSYALTRLQKHWKILLLKKIHTNFWYNILQFEVGSTQLSGIMGWAFELCKLKQLRSMAHDNNVLQSDLIAYLNKSRQSKAWKLLFFLQFNSFQWIRVS